MKKQKDKFTVGDLHRLTGVNVETLRYYQSRGLLNKPERQYGKIRRYDASDLETIYFIKSNQDIGFTLEEIKQLIKIRKDSNCEEANQYARRKFVELTHKIILLKYMRSTIEGIIWGYERVSRIESETCFPGISDKKTKE